MSKHAFIIIIIVVAAVALAGGYLLGLNSNRVSVIQSDAAPIVAEMTEPSESASPEVLPSPSVLNPFDESNQSTYSNPLETVPPNPFN